MYRTDVISSSSASISTIACVGEAVTAVVVYVSTNRRRTDKVSHVNDIPLDGPAFPTHSGCENVSLPSLRCIEVIAKRAF